jgi:hypothetical protein
MYFIKTILQNQISSLMHRLHRSSGKGQSLIELALVLPILILILLAIAEGALFMGRYLDLLDLTREAAREASTDDPFAAEVGLPASSITTLTGANDCSADANVTPLNFYFKAACYFAPPKLSKICTNPLDPEFSGDTKFCQGFNRYADFNLSTDDVVISFYTIENNVVKQTWPGPNTSPAHASYWALSSDGGLSYKKAGVTHPTTPDTWQTPL